MSTQNDTLTVAIPTLDSCPHTKFRAHVQVHKFSDGSNLVVELTVKCSQCGEPIQFVGLDPISSLQKPYMSLNGRTAYIPGAYFSMSLTPLELAAVQVKGYQA